MSIQLFSVLFLFSGYFCSVDACVVCIVSDGCNQSSSSLVYVIFESLYQCIDAIKNDGDSFFFFLTYIVCPCCLWHVRPYASSWVFLFSGPFVEFLLWSILRIVPSILRVGQLRYLSLWWDFCYVLWFRVVFSFSWCILLISFSFLLVCLISSTFNISKYSYVSFSPSVRIFFLDLVVLFLPSFVIFCFSLLALHIFLYQIPSLYLDCISSLSVLRFPVLFHFLQRIRCRLCTTGGWFFFSCDLWSLYLSVHFVSIWLSEIAITNSNGDSAYLWKIPLWIFTSVKLFPSALQFSTIFSINFMNSLDILYILRQSIIQLYGIISFTFL